MADDADKKQCVKAADEGQGLQASHKLQEARARFVQCASSACPPLVQQDCATWLAEVMRSLPTIVITAKDSAGTDLINVAVTLDDQPLTSKLDGGAVDVNPGPHRLHLALPDGRALDRTLVVAQGSKDQRIEVTFPLAPGAPVTVPPQPPQQPQEAAAPEGPRNRRVAGIAVGAVGLAGVAAGAAFGALSFSEWSSSSRSCPTHVGCAASAVNDHGNAVTFATASDVGFIAGGVLAAAGVTLYLTSLKGRGASPGAALQLGPGEVSLAGRF